ncbi:MAG: hypothetical protein ACP5R2_14030, partial [Anaerolineae bacterium]
MGEAGEPFSGAGFDQPRRARAGAENFLTAETAEDPVALCALGVLGGKIFHRRERRGLFLFILGALGVLGGKISAAGLIPWRLVVYLQEGSSSGITRLVCAAGRAAADGLRAAVRGDCADAAVLLCRGGRAARGADAGAAGGDAMGDAAAVGNLPAHADRHRHAHRGADAHTVAFADRHVGAD